MLNKTERYKSILTGLESLVDPKVDTVANMANVSAVLHNELKHHWTGFYRVVEDKLILGPFQGPVACTQIAYGKGVCGKAWDTKKTQVVADVHQFSGHIACRPASNSEIVIPCIKNNKVYAVLDIDSTKFDSFDETDAKYLSLIVDLL